MKRSRLKSVGRATLRSRTKFGNTPHLYNGVRYDSRMEAAYAAELDLLMRVVGPYKVASWERQIPVKLEVNGVLVCTYIVDFLVHWADARDEWVEVKGFETPEWKIKEKLFRALYPHRSFRVVRSVRSSTR